MAKTRILKVFVSDAKQAELIESYGLVEAYDAFILLEPLACCVNS